MEGFVNHTEALRWVGKPCECVKRYGATDELEIIEEVTIAETNFGGILHHVLRLDKK